MILDTCVTSRNVEFNPSLPHDKPPISSVLPYEIETSNFLNLLYFNISFLLFKYTYICLAYFHNIHNHNDFSHGKAKFLFEN